MATTIKSTQLDFDTIKSKLKEYLKQQTEFADYDFEASGLSNILDVLAYNTHFTGLNANFALNTGANRSSGDGNHVIDLLFQQRQAVLEIVDPSFRINKSGLDLKTRMIGFLSSWPIEC